MLDKFCYQEFQVIRKLHLEKGGIWTELFLKIITAKTPNSYTLIDLIHFLLIEKRGPVAEVAPIFSIKTTDKSRAQKVTSEQIAAALEFYIVLSFQSPAWDEELSIDGQSELSRRELLREIVISENISLSEAMKIFRKLSKTTPNEISEASLLAQCISLMLKHRDHEIEADQKIKLANSYLDLLSSIFLAHDDSNDTIRALLLRNIFIKLLPDPLLRKSFFTLKAYQYSFTNEPLEFFKDFLAIAFSNYDTKQLYQADISLLIPSKQILHGLGNMPIHLSIIVTKAIETFACYMVFGHGDCSKLDFDAMNAQEFAKRVLGIDLPKN